MNSTAFTLENTEATEEFGMKLSPKLRAGDIVKIIGPLGAGKTTLVRGIVAGLGGDPGRVHSPTFSIVHEYQGKNFSIIHCDFYRLKHGTLLEEFGGEEFFDEPKIFLIEWPEQSGVWKSITRNRLLSARLEIDYLRRKIFLSPEWQIVD